MSREREAKNRTASVNEGASDLAGRGGPKKRARVAPGDAAVYRFRTIQA